MQQGQSMMVAQQGQPMMMAQQGQPMMMQQPMMMAQPGQPMMMQQPVMMAQPGQPMMMQQPGQPMMMQQGGQQMVMQPVMMPGQPMMMQQGGQMAQVSPTTPGYICTLLPGEAMQVSNKLQRIFLGIGWKNKGKTVDVDASVVLFAGGKTQSRVSYKQLKDEANQVVHTGDILTGGNQKDPKLGDDLERIYIWLSKVGKTV